MEGLVIENLASGGNLMYEKTVSIRQRGGGVLASSRR